MKENTATYTKSQGRNAAIFEWSEVGRLYKREDCFYIAKYWEGGECLEEIDAMWKVGYDEAREEMLRDGSVLVWLRALRDRLDDREPPEEEVDTLLNAIMLFVETDAKLKRVVE